MKTTDNMHRCPICDSEMTQDDDELTFSSSYDINERGDSIDLWYASWHCANGHFAQEWYEGDSDDNEDSVEATGDWTYNDDSGKHWGYRDEDGILHRMPGDALADDDDSGVTTT